MKNLPTAKDILAARAALKECKDHHINLNRRVGRPITQSRTIKLINRALKALEWRNTDEPA